MHDTHIHTKNSVDSKQTIDEVCKAAIKAGLSSVSICDHADMWFIKERNTVNMLKNCINELDEAKRTYLGRLKILQGIELSEYLSDTLNSDKILSLCNYDVILGSVHCAKSIQPDNGFSATDMSEISEKKIHTFICDYFSDMIDMIEGFDFDILTHLTLPLRYLNGKYKRGIDISPYDGTIESILRKIVEKDIALEVNTSGIDSAYGDFLPDEKIIRKYKSMGGKLITIGSDAHSPERVGYALNKAKKILCDIGFTHYYYYEKRKPVAVSLKILSL